MDTIRQDVRYAFRRLLKSPGFTVVALLTLALGIGANSAIFSVINGVLLTPLPYPEPERLVGLFHLSEGQRATMSGPNFHDLRALSKTLTDAAAATPVRTILTGRGEPVRLDGAKVSGNIFDLLGVPPLLGRTLRLADNEAGGNRDVVVLSFGLWQQRFGADRNIVGKKITLDGVATEVVGVMPQGFAYPSGRVLWTPINYDQDFTTGQRAAWYLSVIGRAGPGITSEQVDAEVRLIGKQLATKYPDSNEGVDFAAVPLLDAMVGEVRKAMFLLLGAVGFVLIVRHAMLVAAAGVAAGLTAAWFLSTFLASFLFATDPRDAGTFITVAATLTAVALVASYLPARRATKVDPVVALRAD